MYSFFHLKLLRKGNVCKIALNTFVFEGGFYGIRQMVKERENPLLPLHGLLFPLSAIVLLCAPSHRQDSTYHSLCYTSCGVLDGTRNSSVGPPLRIDPTTHHTMNECSYHGATSRSDIIERSSPICVTF